MKREPQNIGIVTFPISAAGNIPLSNLVDILYSLSNELYLITGGVGYSFFTNDERVHTYEVRHKASKGILTRALNYIYTQLEISWKLMKLRKNVDLWIFFIGGEGLVLPILTAKVMRKNVVISSAGSGFKVARAQEDPLTTVNALLQSVTYRLSDRIIMYSERLVEEHGLQKYRHKISIAHEHFLDFDKFKVEKPVGERGNLVGYVGRLSKEKGILNFLEAIPDVLEARNELAFLIGGDGQLRLQVEECASKLDGKVKFVGWIPHDELPRYLNELKLLVLPSYTEGLPNIMLEAMAFGTPVLATPVGAIPDIIKDGETGFIMEDNSPECIAQNIIRALNHPNLEKVARNACALVEREFTFEKAVERYGKIVNGEW